jgi:hypothetical protein
MDVSRERDENDPIEVPFLFSSKSMAFHSTQKEGTIWLRQIRQMKDTKTHIKTDSFMQINAEVLQIINWNWLIKHRKVIQQEKISQLDRTVKVY